jgi:hypothetical protein
MRSAGSGDGAVDIHHSQQKHAASKTSAVAKNRMG